MKKSIFLTVVASVGALSFAVSDVLDLESGTYSEPTVVSIAGPENKDEGMQTIKIDKIDSLFANLKIETISTRGNMCDFEGKMKAEVGEGGKEFYYYNEKILDDTECTLTVSVEHGNIIVNDHENSCAQKYCGFNGNLAGSWSVNSLKRKNGKSATNIISESGTPTCFRRFYSSEHLRKNKKQLVSEMELIMFQDEERSFATLLGTSTKNGLVYNASGFCPKSNKDNARCEMDGDAGGLKVQNNKDGSIYVIVDDYVALEQQENGENEEGWIFLEDSDNRIFKLYPASCSDQ